MVEIPGVEAKVKTPVGLEVEAKVGNPHALEERAMLLDFLVESLASPAIELEGATPKEPCKCFTLPTGKKLCHRKGYIGTLTQEQMGRACSVVIPIPDGRRGRYTRWLEAVETCKERIKDIRKGEKLMPWLDCMGVEASRRGIEL